MYHLNYVLCGGRIENWYSLQFKFYLQLLGVCNWVIYHWKWWLA